MEFARRQMVKYGWKEGKGLGKEENGMTTALKPKQKRSKSGIGRKIGDEFSIHWWEHAFNKASSSINIMPTEDGVEVKKVKAQDSNKKKSLVYGSFIKQGTLQNDGTVMPERSDESDAPQEVQVPRQLSDEELFAFCGGCTAHKAARHGHRLSGKLARVAQQEMEFFDVVRENKTIADSSNNNEDYPTKKKKNKTPPQLSAVTVDMDHENTPRIKKKKRRCKELDELGIEQSNKSCIDFEEDNRIHVDGSNDNEVNEICDFSEVSVIRKRKKKMKLDLSESSCNDSHETPAKKHKKKKKPL